MEFYNRQRVLAYWPWAESHAARGHAKFHVAAGQRVINPLNLGRVRQGDREATDGNRLIERFKRIAVAPISDEREHLDDRCTVFHADGDLAVVLKQAIGITRHAARRKGETICFRYLCFMVVV